MARKKKLNKRVVVLLGAIGGLVGLAVIAVVIARQPADPQALVLDAQALLEKGRYSQAVEKYAKAAAVSRKPEHRVALAEALWQWVRNDPALGEAERAQKFGEALREFREAARLDPDNVQAHQWVVKLERLRVENSTQPDYIPYIDALDELYRLQPRDDEVLFERAKAKAAMARSRPDYVQPALEDFGKLLKMAPKEEDYWLALGRFHLVRDEKEEAERTYVRALQINPASVELRVALSEVLRRQEGRKDQALALLEDAVKKQPDAPPAYLALSVFHHLENRIDKAVELLRACIKAVPHDPRAYVRLTAILHYRKQLPQAEALLRSGLKAVEAHYHGEATAELTGDELSKYRYSVMELNHQLCDALLDQARTGQKKLPEALEAVQEPLRQMESIRAGHPYVTKIRGRLALMRGDAIEAEQLLRKAYREYPRFEVRTAQLLINLYRRMGQLGEAEKIIERFLAYSGESRSALLALARLNVDYRRYDRAEQAVRLVLKQHPDDEEARSVKAVIDVVAGRTKRIPEEIKTLDEQEERLYLSHAKRLWLEGDQGEAFQLTLDVLSRKPKSLSAVLQLLRWYRLRREEENYNRLLAKAMEIFSEDPRALQRLAIFAEPDPEKRLAYRLEVARQQTDPVRRALMTARAYADAGRGREYLKHLKEAETHDPKHPAVVDRLFGYALARADWKQAGQYAATAAEIDIDKVGGRMYQARLAAAKAGRGQGEWADAIRLAREVLRLRPRYSEGYAFLGDCYMQSARQKKVAEEAYSTHKLAEEAYSTAYEQNPSNVKALLGLVRVSAALNQPGPYAHYLKLAYKFQPANPTVRELYLQYQQAHEKPEDMIKAREQILKERPNDLGNLQQLADLYERVGGRGLDRAKELYTRMMRVPRARLAAVRRLADLLRRMDQDIVARKLLVDEVRTARDKVAAYLIWAGYLESVGEHDEAAGAFAKAVEVNPEDPRGYINKARFHGRRQQWEKAVQAQKEYLKRWGENPYTTAERELINYLIEAERYDEVQQRVDRALAEDDSDVGMLALKGLAYVRQGDYDRAKQALDRCLQVNPVHPEALMYRAQVHLAKGQLLPAKNDLEAARRANPNPAVTRELARVYENMGDFSSAHAVLRGLLADNPSDELTLRALVALCEEQQKWPQLEEAVNLGRRAYPRELRYLEAQIKLMLHEDKAAAAAQLLAAAKKELPETARLTVLQMRALIEAGRADQALTVGRPLRAHADYGPSVMALCGLAHAAMKDPSKAEADLTAALKAAGPGSLDFVVDRIREAYGEQAVEKLVQWVALRPDSPHLRALVGNMLVGAGRSQDALAHLKAGLKVAEEPQEQFRLHRILGLAYYDLRRFDDAAAAYEQALKLRPKDQITLNNYAWLLVKDMNKPDEALKRIRRALELEPYNPHALDTYGVVLIARDRLREAVEVLNRSADLKEMAANRLHLGQAYEKLGQKERALREYRRGWEKAKDGPRNADYKSLRDALKRLNEAPEERTGP